jgi:hypothetical protein
LWAVHEQLYSLDPQGARTAAAIRAAFDQIYDGRRTGRWEYTQLMKTEKTHVGTLIEIWMQREFNFLDGSQLDFRIAGAEVDCKWSRNLYEWEIPLEMYTRGDQIALLVWGSEYDFVWSSGLLRISEEVLRPSGRQRDGKRRLSQAGCDRILWLHRFAPMIRNTLIEHQEVAREAALQSSGQRAVEFLFRSLPGVLVNQATVEAVAQQIDSGKRVRDARPALAGSGFIILGHYRPHPDIARALGLPVPTTPRGRPSQGVGGGWHGRKIRWSGLPSCPVRAESRRDPHEIGDPVADVGDVLVLPESHHRPPGNLPEVAGLDVTSSVGRDLGRPELRVRLGSRVVLRAAVPEAAVDENGHLAPREDDVGGAAEVGDRSAVHEVAQTASVQFTSHGQLWSGVTGGVGLHTAPNAG